MNNKRVKENKWLLAEFSYSKEAELQVSFLITSLCNIWKKFMSVRGAKYKIVYSERSISYEEFGVI